MRSIIVLVFLAACSTAPAPVPPDDVRLLRNPTAQMGSQVDVSARDIAGTWVVRQGVVNRWPLTAGPLEVQAADDALLLPVPPASCDDFGLCSSGAGIEGPISYGPAEPGRWVSSRPDLSSLTGLPEEIWVLWMDFDRRTVALGDPDGTFVAILDRNPTGGADRITAARDILDWYGYDLRRLEEVE